MRGHGPGMARYEDFEEYRDAPCRVIAVDFDGVLCKSAWPEIGAANSRIIAELRNRQMLGDKITWGCSIARMILQGRRRISSGPMIISL